MKIHWGGKGDKFWWYEISDILAACAELSLKVKVQILPAAVTLVLHQGWVWSTDVHSLYTTPLYLKGKMQVAPDVATQEEVEMVWVEQEEVWEEMSQSPQLLVITEPSEEVAVAHQGTGESA